MEIRGEGSTENGMYIDNTHSADFHMILQQFVPASDENVLRSADNVDHIIGHESMAPGYEVQSDLALADTAPSGDDYPNPVNIDEVPVNGCAGCKFLIQIISEHLDDLCRSEGCREHGYTVPLGTFHKTGRRAFLPRDEYTGDLELEDPLQRLLLSRRR